MKRATGLFPNAGFFARLAHLIASNYSVSRNYIVSLEFEKYSISLKRNCQKSPKLERFIPTIDLKPRSCAQFAPGCKFAPGVQICTRGVFLAM